jgi:SAM-dependent methyltransferase
VICTSNPPERTEAVDFGRRKDTYRDEVQKSMGFVGQDMDFFVELKANYLLDIARRRLGDPKSLSFLDVGCGVGLTDQYLEGEVGALHGIDVAEGVIERARERNPWAEYVGYDGENAPFSSEHFDLTFVVCVLHHVNPASWQSFVEELARVTRRGGLVVVLEHNPFNPLTRLAVSRCDFDDDAVLLRARQTRKLLEGAGLTVAEARYIVFFPWRGRILRDAENRLGRLALGAQYAVAGARG